MIGARAGAAWPSGGLGRNLPGAAAGEAAPPDHLTLPSVVVELVG
jgi:hypothetical protein